ncbi:MAG: DUF3467 domain-containing protein [Marinilabiliaceae bacterium]|nr:DUF3467 domain-containing protein [Marinilabiliaceae bacterium]
MEDNNTKQLSINLTEDVRNGKYSNLAVLTHSHSEFVVDFVNVMPGSDKANVVSRIILTPDNAKRLLHALHDNVQKFEVEFGEIKLNPQQRHFSAELTKPKGDA